MEPDVPKKGINREWIRQYILPILGICVFIVIMFGFLVPSIFSIIDGFGEVGDLNDEIDDKNDELATIGLVENNLDEITTDLQILDSVTPGGDTEVLAFRDRIVELANSEELSVISQNISEANTATTRENENENVITVQLREIPVNFELGGAFANVISFSDEISALEDFIIIKEMELNAARDANSSIDLWNFILQFTKYQFNDQDSEEIQNIYLRVPITAEVSPSIQEYIDSKKGEDSSSQ